MTNFFFQATAIWLSKEVPKAKEYKSSELVDELSLRLHDFVLLQTGDPMYRANPLLGTMDMMEQGEVREFLSPEMGLIQMTGSDKTVLFHLNQVWTSDTKAVSRLTEDSGYQQWDEEGNEDQGDEDQEDNDVDHKEEMGNDDSTKSDEEERSASPCICCTEEGLVLLKTLQDVELSQFLPLGSRVWVNYRQLPASPGSYLKKQATIVMKAEEDIDDDSNTLPEEYINMINSYEQKIEFVQELDELHDLFKTIKYTDIDFKHGLDYRERMSKLAEEEDLWDDEEDEDEEDDDKQSRHVRSRKPIQHKVPDHVGTVSPDVKLYDETRLFVLDGEPQWTLSNCVGSVDQILSDHLAIISFNQDPDRMFKVLCSSEDTFLLNITRKFHDFKDFKANNEMRFKNASEIWRLSAKNQQKSLFSVLDLGQEVVFNAVALLCDPDTNLANMSYVTTGMVVTQTGQTSVPVPLTCLGSGHNLTQDFKQFFSKIIESVDCRGHIEEGSDDILNLPPEKFSKVMEGRRGKMTLRPEFCHADVLITFDRAGDMNMENTKNVTDAFEDEIVTEDLKTKDVRKLIDSYCRMVIEEKLDIVKLKQNTKIDKPLHFFEEFHGSMSRKCKEVQKGFRGKDVHKGFRVGKIFVNQSQVQSILNAK